MAKNEVVKKDDTPALVDQIMEATSQEEVNRLMALFNQNIRKKNMMRLNKLQDVADLFVDEVVNRVESEGIADKDLPNYVRAIMSMIEATKKDIDGVSDSPTIQINTQTNNFNLSDEGSKLSKESRDKVCDIINAILKEKTEQPLEEVEVIEEEEEDD